MTEHVTNTLSDQCVTLAPFVNVSVDVNLLTKRANKQHSLVSLSLCMRAPFCNFQCELHVVVMLCRFSIFNELFELLFNAQLKETAQAAS
jgi:hypothetical protein